MKLGGKWRYKGKNHEKEEFQGQKLGFWDKKNEKITKNHSKIVENRHFSVMLLSFRNSDTFQRSSRFE